MEKIYQRLVDKNKGDCMRAAIASLLNMDYEQVPNFIEDERGYFPLLWEFLQSTDYEYKGFLHNPMEKVNMHEECFVGALSKYDGVDGIFYASVYSPKYYDTSDPVPNTHAVLIDKNYNIVHDPNPGNKDVIEYPLAKELGYNGIINIMLLEKKK